VVWSQSPRDLDEVFGEGPSVEVEVPDELPDDAEAPKDMNDVIDEVLAQAVEQDAKHKVERKKRDAELDSAGWGSW
jgi:hypothetical protein